MSAIFKGVFAEVIRHLGPKGDTDKDYIFPVGRFKLNTTDDLTVAYVNHEGGDIRDMFVLEGGRSHIVMRPLGVVVTVECDKKTSWSVRWPGRFNPADPTRVEAELVRPRSQKEEIQDYLNEVAARTLDAERARKIRSGEAEFDFSNEDFSEEHEDDMDTPLSVHQLKDMIDIMQEDLKHELALDAKEKEAEEAFKLVKSPPDPQK